MQIKLWFYVQIVFITQSYLNMQLKFIIKLIRFPINKVIYKNIYICHL